MKSSRVVSLVALICAAGTPGAALAGSASNPAVIQGIGPDGATPAPSGGRYGGGLIEFMMTGTSPGAHAAVGATPSARAARAYVAHVAEPQSEPDYGFEPASGEPPAGYEPSAQVPVAGYESPRKAVDPQFLRQEVSFDGRQAPGTIVIDTTAKFLYLVEGEGHALRYGIGVGRPGFVWQGEKTITRKAEWPDWTPPSDMLKRRPDLPRHMDGGIGNPLGARAMYLGTSLYRIHGTNEPDTIGTNVSSGCIRLTNDDVADLYGRVRVGTHVIVL